MAGIEEDERTRAVTNAAGYRAFLAMSWLVVAALAIRGFRPELAQLGGLPVDLLVIVAGGALTFLVSRESASAIGSKARWSFAIAFAAAAAIAAVLVAARG